MFQRGWQYPQFLGVLEGLSELMHIKCLDYKGSGPPGFHECYVLSSKVIITLLPSIHSGMFLFTLCRHHLLNIFKVNFDLFLITEILQNALYWAFYSQNFAFLKLFINFFDKHEHTLPLQ